MHSQLKTYLNEISQRLSKMPAEIRDDELLEVSKHLGATFAAGCGRGLSEDDAARAAIRNFGAAGDVAAKVMWTWRRGERSKNLLSFLGALACFAACTYVFVRIEVAIPGLNTFTSHPEKYTGRSLGMTLLVLIMELVLLALPAAVTGYAFPRRGALATAVLFGGFFAFCICAYMRYLGTTSNGFVVHYGVILLWCSIFFFGIEVLVAKAFSRLRLRAIRA